MTPGDGFHNAGERNCWKKGPEGMCEMVKDLYELNDYLEGDKHGFRGRNIIYKSTEGTGWSSLSLLNVLPIM